MHKNSVHFMTALVILGLALTACGGGGTSSAQPTAAGNATAVSSAPTLAPAPTATPAGPALGAEERALQGGFAFLTIPGYEVINEGDFVSIEAAGSQSSVGPGIVFLGGPNKDNVDTGTAFEQFMQQFTEVKVLEEGELALHDFAGRKHDFTAQSDGQDVRGRFIALASPDNQQVFIMLALTPPDQWETTEPYFSAVTDSLTFFEPEGPKVEVLRQWTVYAQGSSTFGNSDSSDWWLAEQSVGEPDNLDCAVTSDSWTPQLLTEGEDWLIVQFDRPVAATEINLYAAAGPVPLTRVTVYDVQGLEYEIYSADAATAVEGCPGLLTIPASAEEQIVSARLYFDRNLSNANTAIDAVELVGEVTPRAAPPAGMIEQWASQAAASSESFTDNALTATGEQDIWQCGGSWNNAWIPFNAGTVETLEVGFDTPVRPDQLQILQSYGAGLITKVEVLDVDGVYHEVVAQDPRPEAACPEVETIVFGPDFAEKITGARITVDQTQSDLQPYIDAVVLIGTP